MRTCSICRRNLITGMALFALPLGLSSLRLNIWKAAVGLDKNGTFPSNFRICERHFEKKYVSKTSERTRLIPGAIPTIGVKSTSLTAANLKTWAEFEVPNEKLQPIDNDDSNKKGRTVPVSSQPSRVLNGCTLMNNIDTGSYTQNVTTHYFEITYLPDNPGEKPRKELVKKNIIIKSRASLLSPQENTSATARTNIVFKPNQPLVEENRRLIAPLTSAAAYRVRKLRDRIREMETEEEAEARRKKERERKRLSRQKIKMQKLALQSIESADSDQFGSSSLSKSMTYTTDSNDDSSDQLAYVPEKVPLTFPISTGSDQVTFKTYTVTTKNIMKKVNTPELPQPKFSIDQDSYEDIVREQREQRRKHRNRERQQRFRARKRAEMAHSLTERIREPVNSSLASNNVEDSSDSVSRDGKNNSNDDDVEELFECLEMMPDEEYLDLQQLE